MNRIDANASQIFRHIGQRRALVFSVTFLTSTLLISEHAVKAQCPAVGQDTTCGTVTSLPMPSLFFQIGNPFAPSAPPPFLDPPPGGYVFELAHGFPNGDKAYPFYYDPRTSELAGYETSTTLSFGDGPSDPCLFGGKGDPSCGGKTAPKGSQMAFTTHLVGVLQDFTAQDLGIGFTWVSNFNGTSGGVATTKNSLPADPGSGTGGITILSVQENTTYQGVNITSVNGNSPGAPQPLTNGSSCNGVYSGTFNGSINVSSGQNCSLVNGTVTGSIFVFGGSLSLSDVLVNGSVQVNGGGTFSINSFSAIQQNVDVAGIQSGLPASQLCQSTVYGTVQIDSSASGIQLGSTSPSTCAGNVVGGSLQIQGNSGPVQVFGNTVTGVLSCDANSSISGGANSAQSKQDQCASF